MPQALFTAATVEWKGKNGKVKSTDGKSYYINPYEGSPKDLTVDQGKSYLGDFIEKPDSFQGKSYNKKILTKAVLQGGAPTTASPLPMAPPPARAPQLINDSDHVKGMKIGNALNNSTAMAVALVHAMSGAGLFIGWKQEEVLVYIKAYQEEQFGLFKQINGVA